MPLPYTGGDSYYYTDEYKVIVRSCKEVLLKNASYTPFLELGIKYAYRYNFHKFLRQLRTSTSGMTAIPEELIWTISFINGIENPNQDFSHLKGIYTVTYEQIDLLIQSTRTVRQ
ncbi:hypothetical protein AH04_77 [Erwinia phage AH04]|uniref:Uncharacterized protein n=1 Tax=Erwinia phage AH04 TaxID=2869569 RepID=A0AAE8BQV3_9CAUD|nr:hypothetical protein PQC02_gp237 [Erwinia phage AH04]QZA70560.1 hypothetical protein AH04_77 [Erwinia phage AH04]